MPTDEEIIRGRALQDLGATLETRDRNKAAIETERRVRVGAVDTVQAAVATHAETVRKADAAWAGESERIRIEEENAKAAALKKEGDDGYAASQLVEEEKAAAHFACEAAKDAADRVYNDAYKAAGRLVGVQADKARKAAKGAYDTAVAEARHTYDEAIKAAIAKMNSAFETFKDDHDAAVKAAYEKATANRETAEGRHRDAVDTAAAALSTALAADPQARGVEEECARRLTQEDERYSARCAAIMERMARELEELRRGGMS